MASPSAAAVAISGRAGSNANDVTAALCPSSRRNSFTVAESHSALVWSQDVVAITFPFGENLISEIGAACPESSAILWRLDAARPAAPKHRALISSLPDGTD